MSYLRTFGVVSTVGDFLKFSSPESRSDVSLACILCCFFFCMEYFRRFLSSDVDIARCLLVVAVSAVNSRTSLFFNKRVESC